MIQWKKRFCGQLDSQKEQETEYELSQTQKPDMPKRYTAACEEASKSSVLKKYFSFITEKGGIIVDLASGPSGYFAPAFDLLKETDLFIAADGSKTILEAHARL